MTTIITSLVVIAVLLALYGVGIAVFCWFLFARWDKENVKRDQAIFHLSEISKNLGGRPFFPDAEKIETHVVINDLWDDERQGKD